MKTVILAAAAALALAGAAGAAQAGDVTVHVKGVQARPGTLIVALEDKDHFLQPGSTYHALVPNPPAGEVAVVLKDVAPGDYAAVVFHDENDNKRMDYDANGHPMEGWGISRYEPNTMPSFDASVVTVGASGASIDVEMAYPPK
jgi:uncharacterized protein (DUF2141 family)